MGDFWEGLSTIAKWFTAFVVTLFLITGVVLAWNQVFGPLFADQDRVQFERSKTHQGAVVQDFADRCAELATTTDPVARKAIIVVIAQRAATEDLSKLQMNDSVRECVEKAVKEYSGASK